MGRTEWGEQNLDRWLDSIVFSECFARPVKLSFVGRIILGKTELNIQFSKANDILTDGILERPLPHNVSSLSLPNLAPGL